MRRLLPWLLVVLLVAAGCQSTAVAQLQPGAAVPTTDLNPQARDLLARGGELRLATTDLGRLNPLTAEGTRRSVTALQQAVLPQLTTIDTNGALVPDSRWLVSFEASADDPLVTTWTINPNAVWSDLSPVSWRDFAAVWTACSRPATVDPCTDSAGYRRIASVTRGVDDRQAVVTFTKTTGQWRRLFPVLLKADSIDTADRFADWVPGRDDTSGPFRVESSSAASLMLAPDPAWWGSEPLLSRVTFKVLPSASQASAFVDNEIDVLVPNSDPRSLATGSEHHDAVLRRGTGPIVRELMMNARTAPLDSPEVRQAILLALDRGALTSSDVGGIDWSPRVVNSALLTLDQPGYVDQAQATGLGPDPAAAIQLLTDAGWTRSDGFFSKGGKELSVTVVRSVGENESALLANQLTAVGIRVRVVEPEAPVTRLLAEGRFQLAVTSRLAPVGQIDLDRFTRSGAANSAGIGSETIDAAADQWWEGSGDETALAQAIAPEIWKQAAVIPLYQRPELVMTKRNLANFGASGATVLRWEDIGFAK